MRLLLDEHLSPEIARQLRDRGHDVVAVSEEPGLRGRADRAQFASLATQQRAIVTRDLGDHRPLLAEATRRGSTTYGLVCVPRRLALNRAGIGRVVRALDALLNAHPQIDAALDLGGEIWLDDPPAEPTSPSRRAPSAQARVRGSKKRRALSSVPSVSVMKWMPNLVRAGDFAHDAAVDWNSDRASSSGVALAC